MSVNVLFELRPICPELLAFYTSKADEMTLWADSLGVPAFSPILRKELGEMVRNPDALCLIEAVTRHSRFNDAEDLVSMRRAVSKRLRARRLKESKGKRANHGLVKLVATLMPLMLFYGIPLATGERSRLVTVLRMIADEVGVVGDPRDELRRLCKLDRRQAEKNDGYQLFLEAFARGINPD